MRRRSRLVAILAVLLGAGLVVLAAGRPWVHGTVVGLPGPGLVTADGRSVAPGAPALALVAAAGAVVLAASGRVARAVVAGLLVAAGAGIVLVTAGVFADATAALGPAVTAATGTTGGTQAFTGELTVWPEVSAAAGVVVALGGLLALARGHRWSGPSSRFERGASGRAPGIAANLGKDPEGEATPPASGTKVTGRLSLKRQGPVPSSKDRHLDVWDRLSAGEDPTD